LVKNIKLAGKAFTLVYKRVTPSRVCITSVLQNLLSKALIFKRFTNVIQLVYHLYYSVFFCITRCLEKLARKLQKSH
jgi:hypothetical protein